MIEYRCPGCGARLRSPDSLGGKTDTCPKCDSSCPVPPAPSRVPFIVGLSAAGLVIVGLGVVIIISAMGGGRGASPTGGTDGVVDSSDTVGTGGPKQEAAYRKPLPEKTLSALGALGDAKFFSFEMTGAPYEQFMKCADETKRLPLRIHDSLAKRVRIILKYNCGPKLIIYPSEHPAMEPIQRDLGPPEAKEKAYYSERGGLHRSEAEVRDEKPESGDHVPLTWLKYDWIEFGVVGGKVVVIRLDCVAAARDLPK